MNDLSIIIPASRRKALLDCLQGLAKSNLHNLNVEVIVIETADMNIDGEKIFSLLGNVRFYQINCAIDHPAHMRNLGVKKAGGEYLVFFDDDVVVPPDWLWIAFCLLKADDGIIVCGPNIDMGSSFGSRMAQTIQNLYFSEGLKSHNIGRERRKVDFHNIPLNNCAFKKEIFDKIGGFNDQVDYYLDDVEFFFICHRLGYRFFQYPELAIQHHCREFPIDFLQYKFFARRRIGNNAVFFPELYSGSGVIRIIFCSYFLIAALIWLYFVDAALCLAMISAGSIGYVILIILASFQSWHREKSTLSVLVPLGVFLTHVVSYVGFSLGLIWGLLNFSQYSKIKRIKNVRYGIFSRKNN